MQGAKNTTILRETQPHDSEIAGSFLELLRALRRYVREELAPFSRKAMSEEKLRCLGALRFLGKSHLKSLAAYDGLSPSSQCIMLNQLVQEGLVSRSDDPLDRRNVFYQLTEQGLSFVNYALAVRIDSFCKRLRRFSAEDKSRFAGALAVVLRSVEELTSTGEKCRAREPSKEGGCHENLRDSDKEAD